MFGLAVCLYVVLGALQLLWKAWAASAWGLLLCDYKHQSSSVGSSQMDIIFSWDEESLVLLLCIKVPWTKIWSLWTQLVNGLITAVVFSQRFCFPPDCVSDFACKKSLSGLPLLMLVLVRFTTGKIRMKPPQQQKRCALNEETVPLSSFMKTCSTAQTVI